MDIEKLLYIAEEKLPQIRTFILGLFVILGVIVATNGLVVDFANFIGFKIRPFFYPLFFVVWTGYWMFQRFHLPKNKKHRDNIGIVIAIYSENEKEGVKLCVTYMLWFEFMT